MYTNAIQMDGKQMVFSGDQLMLVEINQYSDHKQIKKLVNEEISSIRSEAIREMAKDFVRLYTRQRKIAFVNQTTVCGVILINKAYLEGLEILGDKLQINVLGVLVLDKDIFPALALRTIHLIRITGFITCSSKLKSILSDQIQYGLQKKIVSNIDSDELLQKTKDRFLENHPLRMF